MLERVTAIEFASHTPNGKTKPLHLVCEKSDQSTVEVIAKFSAGCERGVISLANEVIAACLAADLALPIPVPYLVEISPEFAAVIPSATHKEIVLKSSNLAFGSTYVTGQYATWMMGNRISDSMLQVAASIFVFDAIIPNPDRREGNSNCIIRGDEIRIFDHELCFITEGILGWKPPWILGGLNSFTIPSNHIFRAGLRGRQPDFSKIRESWLTVSNERLGAYSSAVPPEWASASAKVAAALTFIEAARNNFDDCLREIDRVLT